MELLPLKNVSRRSLPNLSLVSFLTRDLGWLVNPVRRGGGEYSHSLPIRVCPAQRGRDFEAPDLERGIHFRGVF